jgi:predicted  nucleic acid-binding Zn-ribbon protein
MKGEIAEVESMKEQIAALTKELAKLRKQMGLCDDIINRSAKTREELEWLLVEQEKYLGKEENDWKETTQPHRGLTEREWTR